MKSFKIKEIARAVKGELVQGNPDKIINNISTDTRTMNQGDLFVALIGENFDGHNFIEDAAKNAAGGIITDRIVDIKDKIPLILVEDTTTALQDIAKYYRSINKDIKIIGITGSAGKTTTKDIVAEVLRQKFTVLKTEENLNNYIGVPLTILSLTGKEDFGVIEMGMNQKGEIKLLSEIASPQIGIVTNVGPAHLAYFDSVKEIAQEKRELITSLPKEGKAILNYDNKYTKNMKNYFKGDALTYFGLSPEADIYAENINNDDENNSIYFTVNYADEKYTLRLSKPGIHNVYNVLPAIIIAKEYGMKWEQIQKGLDKVKLSSLRMKFINKNSITYINDSYNANPLSMKAAIDVLNHTGEKRKIAVLGDMLELGKNKEDEHIKIGEYVFEKKIDYLITTGKLGKKIADGAVNAGMPSRNVYHTDNKKEAGRKLQKIQNKKDTILIKGSRSMKMEEILEII
ncbi:MAG: UDP-N-acetylmuramoyl-tripeptide--D-alanyl-D-alanine ligase [Halanaerobiaceae bacterium]